MLIGKCRFLTAFCDFIDISILVHIQPGSINLKMAIDIVKQGGWADCCWSFLLCSGMCSAFCLQGCSSIGDSSNGSATLQGFTLFLSPPALRLSCHEVSAVVQSQIWSKVISSRVWHAQPLCNASAFSTVAVGEHIDAQRLTHFWGSVREIIWAAKGTDADQRQRKEQQWMRGKRGQGQLPSLETTGKEDSLSMGVSCGPLGWERVMGHLIQLSGGASSPAVCLGGPWCGGCSGSPRAFCRAPWAPHQRLKTMGLSSSSFSGIIFESHGKIF